MIKTIINKVLKATLSELFVNASSVQLSMGADMFSDSNINLSNLAFRPDIFDVVLQPLKLVSGHLGMLKVEGIAELALGGKLRFQAENIFLLFNVDITSDAEYMQSLKKILIELQSETFPAVLIRELMKRIQGFPIGPEADLKKKRRVMYKVLDYVCKGLHGVLKNIHIRIEIPQNGASTAEAAAHSAFGFIIPQIKFAPSLSGSRPDGVSKLDPLVLLSLRSLQVYSDYDRDSYCIKGSTDAAVAKQFTDRWSSEVHTSLVLPFDVDLTLAIGVRRKIGLLSPKVTCKVPLLRVVFDLRQLQVLRDLTQLLAYATKRSQQLVRVQKIFRKGFPLPRMFEVGGIRLLPHLVIRNKAYPADTTLPPTGTNGLVAFMKERVGERWPTMLWKHLIRLVLSDLKLNRPLGKWWELAKLAQIRRDYAFTYSRLLKRSKDSGHFSFDVNAKIPSDKLRQLFEYEMYLPVKAVMMFRCLATMIATAELFNAKRKKTKLQQQTTPGASKQPFEKVGMKYIDILRIFVELFEVQRDTVIRRFDRHGAEDDDFDGDDSSTIRDSEHNNNHTSSIASNVIRPSRASLYAGELTSPAPPSNASVGSQNSTSRTPKASGGTGSSIANMFKSPSGSNNGATAAGGGGGGGALNSMRNSVKTVVALPNSALKMLSGGRAGNGEHAIDEYDNSKSVFGDLSVFSDFLGGLLPSEDSSSTAKGSENSPNERGAAGLDSAPGITSSDGSVAKEVFDFQLPGQAPALHTIAESVLWILQRHQDVLTVMLPDFNLTTDKITADLRTPLLIPNGERKNVVSTAVAGFSFNVNISQSSQIESPGGKNNSDKSDSTTARKISSLSGALVQVRLVTRQITTTLHLETNPEGETAAGAAAAAAAKGKGSLLTSGLPAYPAEEVPDPYDEDRDDDVTVSDDTSSVRNSTTSSVRGLEGVTGAAAAHKTPAKDLLKAAGPPPMPPKPYTAVPGETVMQGLKRKQQYEAELAAYNASVAASSPAPAAKSAGGGGNSFKTPVGKSILVDEIKLNNPGASAAVSLPISTNPFEREIVTSNKSENALVMCLILDMDEKGEGAADIQVQVGSMAVDASKTVLSNLIRPRVTNNVGGVLQAYGQMMQYLPLLSEPALVIDRDHNVPVVALVQLSHSGADATGTTAAAAVPPPVVQVSNGAAPAPPVAAPVVAALKPAPTPTEVDIEKEYLKQFASVAVGEVTGDESSSSGGGDDNDDAVSAAQSVEELQKAVLHEGDKPKVVTPPPAAPAASSASVKSPEAYTHELAQRRAMIENKNIQQWIGITETHMPKILSICVRTSAVNVQLIEASVLKDLIMTKIHNVIDMAAGRERHNASLCFATDHLLGMLGNILMGGNATFNAFGGGVRKWGSKYSQQHRSVSHKSVVSDLKSTLVVPSTELVIAKATVPYPCLDLHFQGFELKVPMTDETMCHLSAVILAEVMPFFY